VVPNPVRGRATFAIDVPEAAGRVELALYDLAGRRVRTLLAGALPAGGTRSLGMGAASPARGWRRGSTSRASKARGAR